MILPQQVFKQKAKPNIRPMCEYLRETIKTFQVGSAFVNISSNLTVRGLKLRRHSIDDHGKDLALAEMLSIR
jgi:hypothetical protein